MPEVISNTSPIQYLHQLGLLAVLPSLYGMVVVPLAVVEELEEGLARGVHLPKPGELPWARIERAKGHAVLPLTSDLGPGESEVLALALERPGATVIIDDGAGRRCAHLLSVPLTGTLGILVAAKRRGWMPALAPILDRLEELRFRMHPDARLSTLRLGGET